MTVTRDRYYITSSDDLPDLSVAAVDVADLLTQVQAHVDLHRVVLVDDNVYPAGWVASITVKKSATLASGRKGYDGTGTVVDEHGTQRATLTIRWTGARMDDPTELPA